MSLRPHPKKIQHAFLQYQKKMQDAAKNMEEGAVVLVDILEWIWHNDRPADENSMAAKALNKYFTLIKSSNKFQLSANMLLQSFLEGVYDVELTETDEGAVFQAIERNGGRKPVKLISKKEIMKEMGISQQLLYHHENQGNLIPYDVNGNRVPLKKRGGKYYRKSEVEKLKKYNKANQL